MLLMGKPIAPEFESRPQGTMNMHPDMPRPENNLPDDYTDGFDASDMRGKRFTYGHISRERWEEIFKNG